MLSRSFIMLQWKICIMTPFSSVWQNNWTNCVDTREHFILYLQLGATLVGEKKCFSLLVLLLHRIVIQGKRQNALEDLRQDSIIVGESLISHVWHDYKCLVPHQNVFVRLWRWLEWKMYENYKLKPPKCQCLLDQGEKSD